MPRLRIGFLIFAGAAGLGAQTPRDTARTLEKVTVTATRSSLAGALVPLAVTTVSEDELQRSSGIGLDQGLKFVPGVLAQSRAGGTDIRLVIRGYGARGAGDRSNAGTARGVRILLDGFPETEPDGRTAFDAIDLSLADQMDVVRSNASALWGNAAGGLVSVSTVPRFTASRFGLEPMAGSFGLARLVASVGTSVGTTGRAWLDHSNTTQDGWRPNSSGRRQLLSAGVTTELGPATTMTVNAVASNNLIHVPGPLTPAEFAADARQANATYLARRERRHNRTGRLGVNIEHGAGDDAGGTVSLFVNPKFLQRSERNTFRDFTRYHFGASAVAHATHAVGRRRATVHIGTDGAFQSGAILFYDLVNGERGTTLRDNKGEGTRSLGAFVQDEMPLGERLTATIGARYDQIAYDYRNFISPQLDARKTFGGFSPKVGITVRLGPGNVVYFNIGGGVEVPAGNETDPANVAPARLDTITAINPLLDPIRSATYEIGTRRSGVLGQSLAGSYDVALYNTEVSNEIVPYQGGRYYFTAGRARRQGVEVGVSLQSSVGLGAQTAFTYNRHRYASYVVDSLYYGRAGFVADYSGNKVVGVPDFMSSAEAFYHPPRLSWLRMEIGARHTGAYFADDANRVEVPSNLVFDGGISVTRSLHGGATLRGRIAVDNITDRYVVASAFLNPDLNATGEPMAFEPGLPRTIVLSFSVTRAR